MSDEKIRLICTVWPDDDSHEHLVDVGVEKDWPVAYLKDLIKITRYTPLLASIDALDFVLWKCSIPIEDHGPQPEATLSSIRFDHPDDRLRFLNPARTISEYFTEGVAPYTIHVLLVQLPDPGESKSIMMLLLNN